MRISLEVGVPGGGKGREATVNPSYAQCWEEKQA